VEIVLSKKIIIIKKHPYQFAHSLSADHNFCVDDDDND
jgi:hypothetical protein